jgi:ABC-type multidrug transport system fused ATPase/permease subunit
LITIGLSWCYAVLAAWVGESLIIDVTSSTYSFVLNQKRSFWHKFYPNDVLTRLTQDILSVKSFIVDLSHNVIFQSVLLIGSLVILFYMSLPIGLLILLSTPLIGAITYFGNGYLNNRAGRVRALASSFMQVFASGIQQPSLNFSWDLKPFHIKRYKDLALQMKREQVGFVNQIQQVNQTLSVVNLLAGTIAVLGMLRFNYQNGVYTAGEMFALIMYAGSAVQTAIGLSRLMVTGKIDRVAALRIQEILAYKSSDSNPIDPLDLFIICLQKMAQEKRHCRIFSLVLTTLMAKLFKTSGLCFHPIQLYFQARSLRTLKLSLDGQSPLMKLFAY